MKSIPQLTKGLVFAILAIFTTPYLSFAQPELCTGTFSFSYFPDSIQTWVVPEGTTEIRIVSRGGSGGDGVGNGGFGAQVETLMPVSGGQVLSIIVGGAGVDGSGNFPGGGGGASFVWEGMTNLFVAAAGGGGGGGSLTTLGTNNNGNTGGISLVDMMPTPPLNTGGVGGMIGGGGGNGGIGGGAGGAGFLVDGTDGLIGSGVSPTGGEAVVNGGAGGTGFISGLNVGGAGGFGGGAGGGFNGGGGGGGYNGGGGGAVQTVVIGLPPIITRHGGGGGGSFVSSEGVSPTAVVAAVEGNGFVEITCVSAIPTLGQWSLLVLVLGVVILGFVGLKYNSYRLATQRVKK